MIIRPPEIEQAQLAQTVEKRAVQNLPDLGKDKSDCLLTVH